MANPDNVDALGSSIPPEQFPQVDQGIIDAITLGFGPNPDEFWERLRGPDANIAALIIIEANKAELLGLSVADAGKRVGAAVFGALKMQMAVDNDVAQLFPDEVELDLNAYLEDLKPRPMDTVDKETAA